MAYIIYLKITEPSLSVSFTCFKDAFLWTAKIYENYKVKII